VGEPDELDEPDEPDEPDEMDNRLESPELNRISQSIIAHIYSPNQLR